MLRVMDLKNKLATFFSRHETTGYRDLVSIRRMGRILACKRTVLDQSFRRGNVLGCITISEPTGPQIPREPNCRRRHFFANGQVLEMASADLQRECPPQQG